MSRGRLAAPRPRLLPHLDGHRPNFGGQFLCPSNPRDLLHKVPDSSGGLMFTFFYLSSIIFFWAAVNDFSASAMTESTAFDTSHHDEGTSLSRVLYFLPLRLRCTAVHLAFGLSSCSESLGLRLMYVAFPSVFYSMG